MMKAIKEFEEKMNYNHEIQKKVDVLESEALYYISIGDFVSFSDTIEEITFYQNKYKNY